MKKGLKVVKIHFFCVCIHYGFSVFSAPRTSAAAATLPTCRRLAGGTVFVCALRELAGTVLCLLLLLLLRRLGRGSSEGIFSHLSLLAVVDR